MFAAETYHFTGLMGYAIVQAESLCWAAPNTLCHQFAPILTAVARFFLHGHSPAFAALASRLLTVSNGIPISCTAKVKPYLWGIEVS